MTKREDELSEKVKVQTLWTGDVLSLVFQLLGKILIFCFSSLSTLDTHLSQHT